MEKETLAVSEVVLCSSALCGESVCMVGFGLCVACVRLLF